MLVSASLEAVAWALGVETLGPMILQIASRKIVVDPGRVQADFEKAQLVFGEVQADLVKAWIGPAKALAELGKEPTEVQKVQA